MQTHWLSQEHMKGRSIHLELLKNKIDYYFMLALIELATLTDDCSGCYTIPETVQCAMHNVTTSYRQNVQKFPYMEFLTFQP